MKKHLLTLSLFILTQIFVKGQAYIYHPFPDSNAIWSDDWNETPQTHQRLGIMGDTIILGTTYKKIYTLFDTTFTSPFSTYYAAIREQDKRIYTIIDNSNEQLLYDFNLLVGDTITYNYSLTPEIDSFSRVVTKIDSIILMDGTYRKRYYLDANWNCYLNDTIVEGIGSISWKGLFNPLNSDICTCGDSYNFSCFKQNDTVLYMNNTFCNYCFCGLGLSVTDIIKNINIQVSPNPFTSHTTINVSNGIRNATLTVYNLYGQQVKQIKNISQQTFTLHQDHLPSGLYYISLMQNNKIIATDKLVITD
jgi:hypothetical protein